jgi:hypothetical protein
MRSLNRRHFALTSTGAAIAFAGAQLHLLAQPKAPSKTRLILLETGGCPRPRESRHPSAQVILRNGAACVKTRTADGGRLTAPSTCSPLHVPVSSLSFCVNVQLCSASFPITLIRMVQLPASDCSAAGIVELVVRPRLTDKAIA